MSLIKERGIQLIGIHGYAGVGKDTLAFYIHEFYKDVWIEPFAGPLKEACAAAFGIPKEQFTEPGIKEQDNAYWGISPRKIAQFMGTEIFRSEIYRLLPAIPGKSFWLDRMQGHLLGSITGEVVYSSGDTVIIPDVRFQDEADWIVGNGGIIIHLKRDGYEGAVGLSDHASERGGLIVSSEVNYLVLNDSTPAEMFTQAEQAIRISHLTLTRKI